MKIAPDSIVMKLVQKEIMIHPIESLCKIHYKDVCLLSHLKVFHNFVHKFKELGFARSPFPKTMLLRTEDLVLFQMCHCSADYHMFHQLTDNGSQGDRPVVCWVVLLTFL